MLKSSRLAIGAVTALAVVAVPLQSSAAPTPTGKASVAALTAASVPAAKTFKNCTALNKKYPHGVGKSKKVKDRTSGTPVTDFKVSMALYNANKKSDRDKDGIACEKR